VTYNDYLNSFSWYSYSYR